MVVSISAKQPMGGLRFLKESFEKLRRKKATRQPFRRSRYLALGSVRQKVQAFQALVPLGLEPLRT